MSRRSFYEHASDKLLALLQSLVVVCLLAFTTALPVLAQTTDGVIVDEFGQVIDPNSGQHYDTYYDEYGIPIVPDESDEITHDEYGIPIVPDESDETTQGDNDLDDDGNSEIKEEEPVLRAKLRLTVKNASSLKKKLTIYDNVCKKTLVFSKRFDGWDTVKIKACKDFDGFADITVRSAFGGRKKRFAQLHERVVLRYR